MNVSVNKLPNIMIIFDLEPLSKGISIIECLLNCSTFKDSMMFSKQYVQVNRCEEKKLAKLVCGLCGLRIPAATSTSC